MMDAPHKNLIGAVLCAAALQTAGLPASAADDLPLSRDALFDVDDKGGDRPTGQPRGDEALPGSLKDLFDTDAPGQPEAAPPTRHEAPAVVQTPLPIAASDTPGIRGYLQTELAYVYRNPEHWSKTMARLHLGTGGRHEAVKWRFSARLD